MKSFNGHNVFFSDRTVPSLRTGVIQGSTVLKFNPFSFTAL